MSWVEIPRIYFNFKREISSVQCFFFKLQWLSLKEYRRTCCSEDFIRHRPFGVNAPPSTFGLWHKDTDYRKCYAFYCIFFSYSLYIRSSLLAVAILIATFSPAIWWGIHLQTFCLQRPSKLQRNEIIWVKFWQINRRGTIGNKKGVESETACRCLNWFSLTCYQVEVVNFQLL
jgi:hypothetical protein